MRVLCTLSKIAKVSWCLYCVFAASAVKVQENADFWPAVDSAVFNGFSKEFDEFYDY